jgi:hypothetical protein
MLRVASRGLGILDSGSSDCHIIEKVGRPCTEFVNPIETIDDVIEEIKNGNSRGINIMCLH